MGYCRCMQSWQGYAPETVKLRGATRPCRELFNQITDHAGQLLNAGDTSIYSRTREDLAADLRRAQVLHRLLHSSPQPPLKGVPLDRLPWHPCTVTCVRVDLV